MWAHPESLPSRGNENCAVSNIQEIDIYIYINSMYHTVAYQVASAAANAIVDDDGDDSSARAPEAALNNNISSISSAST